MTKCPEGLIFEDCYYPYYGLAPHIHNLEKTGGTFLGSTELKPKREWPDNFEEDPEAKGCGIYYCPYDQICISKD